MRSVNSNQVLEQYTDPWRVLDGKLRCIDIDGQFFRGTSYHDKELRNLLRNIFAVLPSDAAIVPMNGMLAMQAVSTNGSYCDAQVLIIHSRQFDVVSDGKIIPKMEFTFSREGIDRLNRWYWRWYFRLANRFVKRWPLIVEY